MYKDKKILALIPARGGSKRLPGKNIKPICGKPLIAWSIEQALKSELIDKVVVSTDDKNIADVSRRFGANVPFLRPEELSTDTATSVDVALHAYEFMSKQGENFEYIALLEPTSPLRKNGDIDQGIRNLLDQKHYDCLVSAGLIHLEHPDMAQRIENNLLVPYLPRTVLLEKSGEKAYFPYGVIYLIKASYLYKERTFFQKESIPLLIERWQGFEVDDELDFFIIEHLMNMYLCGG
ncbi:MAG: acylneuraminate cytidylyltransferase family protein [Candidatus Omnitrophica bacterium]|nr:acylneuraminate cytidylyltransferase family protein [Candidatus Omnitrophota bacterium]